MFRKNTSAKIHFSMVNSDGDPVNGATVTFEVSKDGGAWETPIGSGSELGGGDYLLNATAGDMNADTLAFRFSASGALTVRRFVETTYVPIVEAIARTNLMTMHEGSALNENEWGYLVLNCFSNANLDDLAEALVAGVTDIEIEPEDGLFPRLNLRQALAFKGSACGGVSSGAVPGIGCTVVLYALGNPSRERISAVCDANGNRTSVALDFTGLT